MNKFLKSFVLVFVVMFAFPLIACGKDNDSSGSGSGTFVVTVGDENVTYTNASSYSGSVTVYAKESATISSSR